MRDGNPFAVVQDERERLPRPPLGNEPNPFESHETYYSPVR